jgi:hypothetical protein
MKRHGLLVIVLLSIFSCSSAPSFSTWYDSWIDINEFSNVITLNEGEEPRIKRSSNIDNDFFEIRSNHYSCIGDTSFNGPDQDITNDIKWQCRQNGATLALYSVEYTDTRYGSSYYKGTGGTYSIRRYDYQVYYFVPLIYTFELTFGIDGNNLSNKLRQEIGRNTGVYVNIVYNNTPAFHANILRGDVIIRINEYTINNYSDFLDIYNIFYTLEEVEVEYVRGSRTNIVKIKL